MGIFETPIEIFGILLGDYEILLGSLPLLVNLSNSNVNLVIIVKIFSILIIFENYKEIPNSGENLLKPSSAPEYPRV